MQLYNNVEPTISSGGNTKEMGMSVTPHAFNALLEKLYQDPFSAVIREITTNAMEAHMLSKTSKKVEIQIPTKLYPQLIFRDFGPGLDDKEIDKYLNCLFSSSKSGDNNFPGGYGLGSKSPLALVDTFNLVSYKDGKAYHCIWYKDKGSLPVLLITNVENTQEENGLKVIIPVDSLIPKFHNFEAVVMQKLRDQLILFRHKIDFINSFDPEYRTSLNETIWDEEEFHFAYEDDKCAIIGKKFKNSSSYGSRRGIIPHVSIGDVCYPLDQRLFQSELLNILHIVQSSNDSIPLRDYDFYLKMPIGVLDIPPNREGITETPENLKTLKAAYTSLAKNLIQNTTNALDTNKTQTERNQALKHLLSTYGVLFYSSSDFDMLNYLFFNSSFGKEVYNSNSNSNHFLKSDIEFRTFNYSSQLSNRDAEYMFRRVVTGKQHKSSGTLTILVSSTSSARSKPYFKHAMDNSVIPQDSSFFLISVEDDAKVKTLSDAIQTELRDLLAISNLKVNLLSETDLTNTYNTFKAANKTSTSRVTLSEQFAGVTVEVYKDRVPFSSLYSGINNNVNKQLEKGKTVPFGPSYIETSVVIVRDRDYSSLPVEHIHFEYDKQKEYQKLKEFSVVSISPGLYSSYLARLLEDPKLTVYYDSNEYRMKRADITSIQDLTDEDFGLYVYASLRDKILGSILSEFKAYKVFVEDALKQTINELLPKTQLGGYALQGLKNLPTDCLSLLCKKEYSKLYPDPKPKDLEDFFEDLLTHLKEKLKTSTTWKQYTKSFTRYGIYTSTFTNEVLEAQNYLSNDL